MNNLANAGDIRQGRAIVSPKGVWESKEILHLSHIPRANPAANSAVDTETYDGESIEVTTIDQIVSELGLHRLDVIRMDIEGTKTRAIHGAQDRLKDFRPHLTIAIRHTSNMAKNSRKVSQAIYGVAHSCQRRFGYCVIDRGILTLWTLYLNP